MITIAWIAAIYLILCIILYLIQALFYFHPEKLSSDFIFKSKYQIPLNEIFIEAPGGLVINALLFTIKDAKGVCFLP